MDDNNLMTTVMDSDQVISQQDAREAPPIPESTCVNEETPSAPRRKRRRRPGENVKPTLFQLRYQRQVREHRASQVALIEDMSKMAAWTWIPGRDRKVCPGIVDLRDARLLTMDRFPSQPGAVGDRCALTLYRVTIDRPALVRYGGANNVEMFKDFMIRPHYRAGGLALDSRNEEIFRQALALDQAMEMVGRGKIQPSEGFDPPPVLLGFAHGYTPDPEWRGPMQEAVLRTFNPDTPPLRCLRSPGGKIMSIADRDGFRIIHIEREGNTTLLKMPPWAILDSKTVPGALAPEGQLLADLPRAVYSRVKEVTGRYPFRSLEWLEHRILDEYTETISVEENVFNKETKQRSATTTTWRCIPLFLVSGQIGRAHRFFLDFRRHLGRQMYTFDTCERDIFSLDDKQTRVDVCRFAHPPCTTDLQFGDGVTWMADLMALPANSAWDSRLYLRGKQT